MKRITHTALLTLLALFVPCSSYAESDPPCSELPENESRDGDERPACWTGPTKITRVYPTRHQFVFYTEYANNHRSSCSGGTRWQLRQEAPNYEQLVSTVLAAAMAGSTVDFHLESSAKDCDPPADRFTISR